VFGSPKKVRGKIVKGKKVWGKWVESGMIIWVFGMSKSEKKERCIFFKVKLTLSKDKILH